MSMRGLFGSLLVAMTVAGTNVSAGEFVEIESGDQGGVRSACWLHGSAGGSGTIFSGRPPAWMWRLPQFHDLLGG